MTNLNLFLYTESSLHAGTGSGLSIVDLPIQRERTTLHPIVQGSGVKGALRSQSGGTRNEINLVFGPEDNASEYAGAVSLGEARVVLFPVRSLSGVFAYITCPQVIARMVRDSHTAYLPHFHVDQSAAFTTTNTVLKAGDKIVLEEYAFTPVSNENEHVDALARWFTDYALPKSPEYSYWREKVQTSLVVLHDDDFRDFVNNSTEVTTHIRLNRHTKTVETGALWTMEALPADVLLLSVVTTRLSRHPDIRWTDVEVANWLLQYTSERIQLGGDETRKSVV